MPQYFTGHEAIQEQEAVPQLIERSHPLERLLHFDGAGNLSFWHVKVQSIKLNNHG